jgi:hypothetical protein
VSESLTPTPHKSIKVFEYYSGNIVYGWRRGNRYLYIGMSTKGSERAFNKDHHVIGKVEDWNKRDVIDIWQTDSPKELESVLIKKLKPKYNGSTITSKRCIRCNYRSALVGHLCSPCRELYKKISESRVGA